LEKCHRIRKAKIDFEDFTEIFTQIYLLAMAEVGTGVCNPDGYYAGWDSKGTRSVSACNAVCLVEPQCTFTAYWPGKTCSRYQGEECGIMTGAHDYDMHTVYKKDLGKFLPSGQ